MKAIKIWIDNRVDLECINSTAKNLNRNEDIVALHIENWILFIAADNERSLEYAQKIIYSELELRGRYCTQTIK